VETYPVNMSKSVSSTPPAGYRFPREVTAVAVRWYLRYGLSFPTSKNCWTSAASASIT
jgi:transposase-like protein